MYTNVLVTSAGGTVAEGIIKSLKLANKEMDNNQAKDIPTPVKYRIIATDKNNLAAGLYRTDKAFVVPAAQSSSYIDSIIEICRQQNIDAIFPGSDDELQVLADSETRINDESEAVLLANPSPVISVARDKWKVFDFLTKNNLPTAATCLPECAEEFVKEFGFPIVVKPRQGYSSINHHVAYDYDDMEYAKRSIRRSGWSPILQEFLPNHEEEYSSGITIDHKGKNVLSSIAMRRILKCGETYKAIVDDFLEIRKSAETIATKIGARGPINVQCRMQRGEPKVFDINPRFSGSCPIRSVAGINEPDIVFRNFVLHETFTSDQIKRLICMRYWNEVYLPLDHDGENSVITKNINRPDKCCIVDYF